MRAACARRRRPVRPAPYTTTSSTGPAPCDRMSLHSRTDVGDPMTITRSPGLIASSPRATSRLPPRITLATFESTGIRASRSGRPTVSSRGRSSGTSNSTISTWPSAKMSVCFAAGMPMMRAIAFAVSTSDATTKSTSSWRSRQMSRYSTFIVRTIVFALESARASIAADDVGLVAGRAGDDEVGALRSPRPAARAGWPRSLRR